MMMNLPDIREEPNQTLNFLEMKLVVNELIYKKKSSFQVDELTGKFQLDIGQIWRNWTSLDPYVQFNSKCTKWYKNNRSINVVYEQKMKVSMHARVGYNRVMDRGITWDQVQTSLFNFVRNLILDSLRIHPSWSPEMTQMCVTYDSTRLLRSPLQKSHIVDAMQEIGYA